MSTAETAPLFTLDGGLFDDVDTVPTTPLELLDMPREVAPGVIVPATLDTSSAAVILARLEAKTARAEVTDPDDDDPEARPDRPLTLDTLAEAVPDWLHESARTAPTDDDAVKRLRYHLNGGRSWDDRGGLVWLPQPHLVDYSTTPSETIETGPSWLALARHLRRPTGSALF